MHGLIWTLGPWLLRPTLPHDTLEGITWGLQWQLGYNKHPFLAAWLCAGVTQWFGTIGWPTYLLAQLAVLTTFIALWKLAQQILPQVSALVAALVLEGVLFYNINSFNFTPDTLQSPLWALLSLFFYQALTQQKLKFWLLTSLLAALCLCTKYQAMLLFLPMVLLCCIHPLARKSFSKPGLYYAMALFFLLITPHCIWLAQHDFISLTYASNISAEYTHNKNPMDRLLYPLSFVMNTGLDIVGVLILLWPFYKKDRETSLTITSFQTQFLFFLGLGPLILSFLLCCFTGDYFPPRWATPYFFALGILAMAYLKPSVSPTQWKKFILTLIVWSFLLFFARMSSLIVFQRPSSDAFLPTQEIALALSQLWQEKYHKPLPFVAGSHYLVAGIVPYLPNHPLPYFDWSSKESPWIREQKMVNQGGLFVWDKNGYYSWDKESKAHRQLPKSIHQRFPRLILAPDFIFYRLSDHQPIRVGIAILPPYSHEGNL